MPWGTRSSSASLINRRTSPIYLPILRHLGAVMPTPAALRLKDKASLNFVRPCKHGGCRRKLKHMSPTCGKQTFQFDNLLRIQKSRHRGFFQNLFIDRNIADHLATLRGLSHLSEISFCQCSVRDHCGEALALTPLISLRKCKIILQQKVSAVISETQIETLQREFEFPPTAQVQFINAPLLPASTASVTLTIDSCKRTRCATVSTGQNSFP